MREQSVILKHHAHAPVFRRHKNSITGNRLIADSDGAGIWNFQPGYQAQGGGLAATAWPQQHQDLALLHRQIQMVHSTDHVKRLGQAAAFNSEFTH